MLYRATLRVLSSSRTDTTLLRAAIHTSGPLLVKKNTETKPTATSSTKKDNTAASKSSTESYPTGETFYNHNVYTFYDAEIDMAKDRIKQPSSQPEKKPLGM